MQKHHKLIGVFGGTFDPLHLGHINAVNELNEQIEFEGIHWVLSARPPHKNQISASIEQRFMMLQLGLACYPQYIADDREIKRSEKSYTLDTISEFKQQYPEHKLCLIIGGDSLLRLATWYRYQELIDQVHIVVMARPGYQLIVPNYLQDRQINSLSELVQQDDPSLVIYRHCNYDISSTHIRTLFGSSTELDYHALKKLLPEPLIDYIQAKQSYKIPPMNPEQIKDQVVASLEDVKGQDIRVIDITDVSNFADFMIVASGTSDTHVKALAREASTSLRTQGVKPIGEDGADIGEWVMVDFGDVVLHVMRPEVREYYDLEKLWDEDVRELVKKHREQNDA
ncbi:MAG: nicotinate-nucleotide adenylyltransferase [Arenicella sp.]|jgi:nicotinate-nucleotide adenylyltransferase